jgi:hypothetical protein
MGSTWKAQEKKFAEMIGNPRKDLKSDYVGHSGKGMSSEVDPRMRSHQVLQEAHIRPSLLGAMKRERRYKPSLANLSVTT